VQAARLRAAYYSSTDNVRNAWPWSRLVKTLGYVSLFARLAPTARPGPASVHLSANSGAKHEALFDSSYHHNHTNTTMGSPETLSLATLTSLFSLESAYSLIYSFLFGMCAYLSQKSYVGKLIGSRSRMGHILRRCALVGSMRTHVKANHPCIKGIIAYRALRAFRSCCALSVALTPVVLRHDNDNSEADVRHTAAPCFPRLL
jgi:hypothetical protein